MRVDGFDGSEIGGWREERDSVDMRCAQHDTQYLRVISIISLRDRHYLEYGSEIEQELYSCGCIQVMLGKQNAISFINIKQI